MLPNLASNYGTSMEPVLKIETLSDGRIVIYVEDPTKVIVLQKPIPLPPHLEGYHE